MRKESACVYVRVGEKEVYDFIILFSPPLHLYMHTELFAYCRRRKRQPSTHLERSYHLGIPVREESEVRERIHRERKSQKMIDPSKGKRGGGRSKSVEKWNMHLR